MLLYAKHFIDNLDGIKGINIIQKYLFLKVTSSKFTSHRFFCVYRHHFLFVTVANGKTQLNTYAHTPMYIYKNMTPK